MADECAFRPNERYAELVGQLNPPSFDGIRAAACKVLSENYTHAEIQRMHDELQRGRRILDREELLWRYLYAFGLKHPPKLDHAFDTMKGVLSQLKDECITVVDWGCGQGLATCCLLDYLNRNRIHIPVDGITLIEPSELAISYAELHLGAYGMTQCRRVQKGLDDVTEEDIETESPVTLHLFSNILDMDVFDMKHLAQTIGASARGTHYSICVGPFYGNNNGMTRMELFKSYFIDIDSLGHEGKTQSGPARSAISEMTHLVKPDHSDGDKFTMELLVFRYECGKSSVIDVEYYPHVQFFASCELDVVRSRRAAEQEQGLLDAAFEVAAPFELGAKVYDDVNPVLAVLNNIIVRGLPTRCSPFIEEAFEFSGNKLLQDYLGGINYACGGETDEATLTAQRYTPIGVARLQKVVLEALIAGVLDMSKERWRVVVIERDVPCAALAFEDLRQMLEHVCGLSKDFKAMRMPTVDLTVVSGGQWQDSPLHLGANVFAECNDVIRSKRYDLVVDVSVLSEIDGDRSTFSELEATRNCYFVVGSASAVRSRRTIYTSDVIEYGQLGATNEFGAFVEDEEMLVHLRFFLNLLFRKADFRPGQVPILNRALQNQNVIGLLPTGGGKSLTYQLAAMLQPGVTLVIDPLRALMQDQYEGLKDAGMDACTFINTTLTDKEKEERTGRMEASELQFIFVSPERLCIQGFRERLATMKELGIYFSYGVIDEVHCVSEWGHDFRFSYLHLGRNLYNFVHTKSPSGHLTLFGLTATASFDVLADVERELSGDGAYPLDANTVVRYEDTDRLELQYKIERVPVRFESDASYNRRRVIDHALPRAINPSGSWHKANGGWRKVTAEHTSKSEYLADHIRDIPAEIDSLHTAESVDRIKRGFSERHNTEQDFEGVDLACDMTDAAFDVAESYASAGIIFCPHRENTQLAVRENAERLREFIPGVGTFVGSSDGDAELDEVSFNNLELFKQNRLFLMVATKAFGMGIDKPNVRFSVNMNYPSSLESLVQEAGRAGRDKKLALAKVLVSDYALARINGEYQGNSQVETELKNRWFREADLYTILDHYGLAVPREFIEVARPDNDLIENVDYATNEYFFKQNFMGARLEKGVLFKLFCKKEVELLRSDDTAQNLMRVENLLDVVLSSAQGTRLVARMPYTKAVLKDPKTKTKTKPVEHVDNVQKMIYRMCCIGFVEDYTQDYGGRYFLIKMVRRPDGGYYEALKRFLMRYYAEERADEIVGQVPGFRGENEIQKCLGYLTEFVYDKIAVKRKRAMDDMRLFCSTGAGEDSDWREVNEDLKDFIYYYFNSKYANDEYVADTGEPFSLKVDTDTGKRSSFEIVMKYLRVVDDDLIGAGGTPIDNVKHLQGAVRLIRRALTDYNPALALLNFFCLTQLGTHNSEALEEEMAEDYRRGLLSFMDEAESKEQLWRFFTDFHEKVWRLPHRYDLSKFEDITNEVIANAHLSALGEFAESYLQNMNARRT